MSAKDSQQLKNLQSRRDKLQVDVISLKDSVKTAQSAQNKAEHQLKRVLQEISDLAEKDVIVSEHAILRFLERKFSLDIEDIKKDIFSDSIKIQHQALGNGQYPITDGLKAVIKNNTVVTVV